LNLTKCPATLRVLGLFALSSALLSGPSVDAGTIILSGDSNIINGLNGSDILPATAGNMTFFNNILGGGNSVTILSTIVGSNLDGVNQEAVLNDYYNGQAGVTSSVVTGPITTSLLAGTNLFIDDIPDAALTSSEVTALNGFLAGGGTFLLFGENQAFTPVQNVFVNTDLAALGSLMRLTGASNDAGLHTATVANGQILPDPLTSGVNSLVYAFTNGVTGGQALFLDSDKTTSFVSAEVMGAATVPEPASIFMVSAGLACVVLARRRARMAVPRCSA
jgi:hypothetical protein